ncbi:hypothetical protein DFO66_104277 [Brevibacterium sanguinis]|uniref:Methionine synthase II (Cobalamin-independent) n=2 Tax=Brevibacterium TaxID=1696 RepID=A0A366IK71_9MICO|nr:MULTISPECIES: hypothetical protein [Brevibacterium]RBP65691.1 hypothetical protein DFO66_104277 [Brevibacterium sanguinis]RBP72325.1 hypothetical protein DFO65_104283 [Brevibacterium celere]
MTNSTPRLTGAHLVGSVSQDTAADTFTIVSEHLGDAVARIPDGEVGERFHWMLFQGSAFEATAGLSRLPIDPILVAGFDVRPFAIDADTESLEFGPLGYAAAAADSYADFSRLRDAGTIPEGIRFQVSLPSPLAPVTTFVAPADRKRVYPAYRDALAREIRAITEAVPHEDLAIQFDLATEFAYIEKVNLGGGVPQLWTDGDLVADLVSLVAEAAAHVPDDVELGFHLCYGDVGEKHFTEPPTTENLVRVANELTRQVAHPIAWIHLPVPIERCDDDYFAPLAGLKTDRARIVLGLVHHEDGIEGAQRRIAAAGRWIPEFGIATECGFGRGPKERTPGLLQLHADILDRFA